MPAGSAAALICDTGALIDYLVESAPDHELFRNAIDQARTRYVPGLVLAEVDYFLRDERQAMQVFMQDLARRRLHLRAADDRSALTSDGRGPTRSPILAWASSMDRSWRSPSLSASVGWRRATCVTSQLFDSAMAARSSWWFIRPIPTIPNCNHHSMRPWSS